MMECIRLKEQLLLKEINTRRLFKTLDLMNDSKLSFILIHGKNIFLKDSKD
jgi:hypothetical protein